MILQLINKKMNQTQIYNITLAQSQRQINQENKQKNSNLNIQKEYKQLPIDISSIKLEQGSSFWNLEDDFEPIYNNFNLLSYFSSSWQIQILQRKFGNKNNNFNCQQKFTFKNNTKNCYLILLSKDKLTKQIFDKNQNIVSLKYRYYIIQLQEPDLSQNFSTSKYERKKSMWAINVEISTQKRLIDTQGPSKFGHIRNGKMVIDNIKQYIHIKIIDQDNWITQKSKNINVRSHHHRVSQLRKSGINETEYFYIEPKNQRNKIFDGQHIHLSIQGGGSKGMVYIGAYDALRKEKPTTPIKSIIGSSIGAIFGLAFCCQTPSLLSMDITADTQTRMIQVQRHPSNDQQFLDYHFNSIMNFLKDFNIFEDQIIKIFRSLFTDQKFKAQILKIIYLSIDNVLYNLFTCKDNKEKLNLTGLLKAEMMDGKILRYYAQRFIKYYLNTKIEKNNDTNFNQKLKLIYENYKTKDIDIISESLTFKELYGLTGIQFTAISVDIDQHVLRFFNQKTTPDLPVSCGIQMSASIPIAFEATPWKKQWGKYYIHYDNIRRQKDLTGCRFTDGSSLANFPMKFWDNQDMRSMYFSHGKTPQTIMYGWGAIEQKQRDANQKIKMKQIARSYRRIGNMFIRKVGVKAPLCSWLSKKINCFSRPKQKTIKLNQNSKPFQPIMKVPLFSFIAAFLQTWYETKDNLNAQCFSHFAYQTKLQQNYIDQIVKKPNEKQQIQQISSMLKQLQNLSLIKNQESQENYRKIYETIKQNINKFQQRYLITIPSEKQLYKYSKFLNYIILTYFNQLQQMTNKNENVRQNLIIKFKNIITNRLHSFVKDRDINISSLFEILQNIRKQRIFVQCNLLQDLNLLKQISRIFLAFLKQSQSIYISNSYNNDCILKKILFNVKNSEQRQIVNIIKQIKEYSDLKQISISSKDKNIGKINSSKNKLMSTLSKIQLLSFTNSNQSIDRIMNKMKNSIIPELFISYESNTNRSFLKSYILNNIMNFFTKKQPSYVQQQQNQKEAGVHIVLESISLSQLYFHQYCKTVKDTILQYNEGIRSIKDGANINLASSHLIFNEQDNLKPVRITTMTATGYHCLVMFLHASDLSQKRIGQEVWKIRDLIRVNQKEINQKFQRADWTKMTPIMLRELQKQAIEKKKDIFKFIEQLNGDQQDQSENKNFITLKQKIQKQIYQQKIANDDIINSMEASLNYVVQLLSQIQRRDDGQQYEQYVNILMKKLVLNSQQMKYQDKFIKNSEVFENMVDFFFAKYKQIFQYIMYSLPGTIDKIVNYLKPQQRGDAWKGIILSQILSGRPIKKYVYLILSQLGLKPQITLKQFYDNSSKKIQMNFSVIEDNIVAIYNHKVRPNMPVWAAIKSASSVPQFFAPVLDRQQWSRKEEENFEKRKVKKYFSKPIKPFKFIISSQILTKFPLDLLRNNKFIKKITDRPNQIFLIFNFSNIKLPNITNEIIKQMNVTPLTLGDVIQKFVSFKQIFLGKLFGIKLKNTQQGRNARAMSILGKLPSLQNKKKQLKLFLASQDNLILKLYTQQIMLFTAKFGTLDFDMVAKKDKEGKPFLTEISYDSMLQSFYTQKEKLNNKYECTIFQKKQRLKKKLSLNSNTPFKDGIQQNNQGSNGVLQKPQRRLFFKVEFVENDSQSEVTQPSDNAQSLQNLHKNQKNNIGQLQQYNKESGKMQSMKNLIIQNQKNDRQYNRKNNHLLIRFLSILNNSLTGALYEKYFIYYKINNIYKRIKKQNLLISEIDHKILFLKVQFPSSDLQMIKVRQFKLDLSQLFNLNREMNGLKLGYVYQLQFDRLYGKTQNTQTRIPQQQNKPKLMRLASLKTSLQNKLTPQPQYSRDFSQILQGRYMPQIQISSIVDNIPQKSKVCDDCIVQLDVKEQASIQKNQKQFQKRNYECPNCGNRYNINDKFNLKLDNKSGTIKCVLDHKIVRYDKVLDKYNLLKSDICDLCGKGHSDRMWRDNECDIYICDPCRIEKLRNINEQY